MMQSTTFMGAKNFRYILNRGSGMMQSNTFTGAKTSGYILNQSSGMMQSHHIHEDQSHRIYFGQMSQDDTIPLHSRGLRSTDHLGQVPRDDTIPLQHHYSPFRGRSFQTTPSLSRNVQTLLETEASSTHHHINHHHLHLQYVNTELSPSVYLVCEY